MEQFRREHEAKIEDYAKIAGSIHKQGTRFQGFLDELGLDINQTVRRESFERIASEGYSEEMQDLLRAQGFNDSQISDMRNFTAENKENLSAMNLTQAHDRLGGAYVQAIRDSANASVLVLSNSMFFNREANLTAPLTQEQTAHLNSLRARAGPSRRGTGPPWRPRPATWPAPPSTPPSGPGASPSPGTTATPPSRGPRRKPR